MAREITAGVFGLVGVLVGGGVTGCVTLRVERLRTQREADARNEDRAYSKYVADRAFEIATLSQMNDLLDELLPKALDRVNERILALGSGTSTGWTIASPLTLKATRLASLIPRISDKQIVGLAETAWSDLMDVDAFDTAEDGRALRDRIVESCVDASRAISKRLGELHH